MLLQFLFINFYVLVFTYAQLCGIDQCDCNIRDHTQEIKSVKLIETRCISGTIRWHEPIGGLRLNLHLTALNTFKNSQTIKLCLDIDIFKTNLKISQDTATGLQLLANIKYPSTSQTSPKTLCLEVNKEDLNIVLFFESSLLSNTDLSTSKIDIFYEMLLPSNNRLKSMRLNYNPMKDCRPCTTEELIQAYCSDDYVLEGVIESVRDRSTQSEIEIHVMNVHRKNPLAKQRKTDLLKASFLVPRQCQVTKAPKDKFLFVGYTDDNNTFLRCSVHISEWMSTKRKATFSTCFLR